MKNLNIITRFAFLSAITALNAQIAPGDPGWPASYPVWWYDAADPANGVIDATQPVLNQDNDAVLVTGQLKHIATEARDELNSVLTPVGGGGSEIDALVNSFVITDPNNLSPANIGQLKNVSSVFFDRFANLGFTPASSGWPASLILDEGGLDNSPLYPWLDDLAVGNASLATIGQAKHLFSWDVQAWYDSTFVTIPVEVNAYQTASTIYAFTNNTGSSLDYSVEPMNNTIGTSGDYSATTSNDAGGPVYVWTDISATGQRLGISDYIDDYEEVLLGFAFPFYDQIFTSVYVGTNGYLTLGYGTDEYSTSGDPLPNNFDPSNMIAGFFDDLSPEEGGDIYFQNFGNYVIIQFEQVVPYGFGDGGEFPDGEFPDGEFPEGEFPPPGEGEFPPLLNYVTFQIRLDSSGVITYYYKEIFFDTSFTTVGIQNSDGTSGINIDAFSLENNLAIQFSKGVQWLSATPLSGTLADGAFVDLSVLLDASFLNTGQYSGAILIKDSVSGTTLQGLQVDMTINSGPGVVIATPVDASVVTPESTLNLTATVSSDPEGDAIDKVEYYIDGVYVGESAVAPDYPVNFQTGWLAQTYSVVARAYDDRGASEFSSVISVSVDPGPDSDLDGINDYYENLAGLDPNDSSDAFSDPDGDGYPSIYEYYNNAYSNDPLSTPTPDFVVDAVNGGNSPTDNILTTIQSAIDAASQAYSIILVEPGTYLGVGNPNFTINSNDPNVLIISRDGAAATILDGELAVRGGQIYNNQSALVGFTIRNCDGSFDGGGLYVSGDGILVDDCVLHNNYANDDGGGIYVSGIGVSIQKTSIYGNTASDDGGGIYSYYAENLSVRNTLIYNNTASSQGGGIHFYYGSSNELVHTTVYNNSAFNGNESYRTGELSADLLVTNSILWNGTSDLNVLAGLDINARDSIIQGTSGYVDTGNVNNTDPQLTAQGLLTAASSAAIDQGVNAGVIHDIQGELRPNGLDYDIGADEFIDGDSDGLPDWLEVLGVTDPSGDADSDGLLNLYEYENGLDVTNSDTDGDGLTDGDEINVYGTDPSAVDTDGDGIPDGEEVANGLDPLLDDSMDDLDGDGYPNIYESRGVNGDLNDPAVVPDPTFTVSGLGSYTTLQSAIDAAIVAYSIILVEPGTYIGTGNPNFTINSNDPNVLIISRDGAATTILDGELALGGGQIYNNQSALVGFTIRNCVGSFDGGGLNISGNEVLIANCTLHDNDASDDGGALDISGDAVKVASCTIYSNSANDNGGGLHIDGDEVLVANCTIYDNTTDDHGGGLYISGDDVVVSGCTVYNNTAIEDGGGIYAYYSERLVVSTAQIYGNSASSQGGGIYNYYSQNVFVENTLIYGNSALSQGGGIYFYYVENNEFAHTTLYNNTAPNGNESYRAGTTSADLLLTNSIVWNDTGDTNVLTGFLNARYSIIRGTSNYRIEEGWVINDDPLLAADGRLTADSTAIDRILNSSVSVDVDGDSRPHGARADVGADEAVGSVYDAGDTDLDGLRDWWEILNFTDLSPLASDDSDVDGLDNSGEYLALTLTNNPDTDGDTLTDGDEVNVYGTDPLNADTDADGLLDDEEVASGMNPLVDDILDDKDGDGYPNIYELRGVNGDLNDPLIVPDATFTVTVDGLSGYATLQSAIDAVTVDYSIILVEPGTYIGAGNPYFNIAANDPRMLIISRDGAEATILDGEQAFRGGVIQNNGSALVGFTIHNCSGGNNGGGLFISGDGLLVANCMIYNNSAIYDGGGIFVDQAVDLIIRSTVIHSNRTSNDDGGGISIDRAVNLIIQNAVIHDNRANDDGGGIYSYYAENARILNSLIYDNDALSQGGGIYFYYGNDNELIHTTLNNNTAPSANESYRTGGSTNDLLLTNSIVWNDAGSANVFAGTSVTARYSIIRGTSGYVDLGNVSNADPQLTVQGLLTMASTAAIDQGTDAGVVSDVHGESRPDGAGYDIGADEFIDGDADGLPDWLEALGVIDSLADNDSDGLLNLYEYENGLDTLSVDTDGDGLNDGDEVNIYGTDPYFTDTDEDSILDNEEVANGLDPLVNDIMKDKDGDGYPNIYELRGVNGDLNDNAVVPDATFTVLADGTGSHLTLQAAINAATMDYSIILVGPGTYVGSGNPNFNIASNDPGMLLVSSDGAAATILDGEQTLRGGLIYNNRSALVGFTIRNCFGASDGGGLFISGDELLVADCIIHNNNASDDGGGIYVDRAVDLLIRNTLIESNRANDDGGGIYSYYAEYLKVQNSLIYDNNASSQGGGIYFYYVVENELIHTTLYNNTAISSGDEIYRLGGTSSDIFLTNSIAWNDGGSTNVLSGSSISARYSIIGDTSGYVNAGNVSNADPQLTARGLLTTASTAAIDQGTDAGVVSDIHGESRPDGGSYDIGADEFIDSDSDGLPDWWFAIYGVTDSSADSDGDSMSNGDEYELGFNPLQWEGLRVITANNPVIDASVPGSLSLDLTLFANEAHDVEIVFYGLNFDVVGQFDFATFTGGDFGNFNFTEIATVNQSLAVGNNTVNWDGVDAVSGQFHTYEVVAMKITSTETDDGINNDTNVLDYTSDYIEEGTTLSFSVSFPDNGFGNAFVRNGRMRFVFGSNGMEPVIANHQIYPGIWNNQVLYRQETIDWLPFTSEGRFIYEQSRLGNNVIPESSQNYFKTRSLPESSIVYTNQNITVTNYSVEAYRSIPSLGEVLHGVFTLSGDARVTLQLYRPDLTPYPLYYFNEGTQSYQLLQDIVLSAGDHALEFVAMNFQNFQSNGEVTLFDDSNMASPVSNMSGYFRVKFIIEDVRTGKVTTQWASVFVSN